MNKIALCGLCLITSNVFGVLASERPNIIVILEDFYNHFISKQF